MTDFDAMELYDKKLSLSEGTEHVRENDPKDKKKVEGYEPHPRQDEEYSEVMGIRNSFDNISVGSDKYGQMLISVTSTKEPGAPTLDSERKVLKGPQRRKKITEFGDFFTNRVTGADGAFAFLSDKSASDIRIYNEFKRLAEKQISGRQRGAAPFLRLDEDTEKLSELRAESGSENETLAERETLEKRVRKETESRNRFMAKLRKARKKYKGGTAFTPRTEGKSEHYGRVFISRCLCRGI